jgi:hypothetical protein
MRRDWELVCDTIESTKRSNAINTRGHRDTLTWMDTQTAAHDSINLHAILHQHVVRATLIATNKRWFRSTKHALLLGNHDGTDNHGHDRSHNHDTQQRNTKNPPPTVIRAVAAVIVLDRDAANTLVGRCGKQATQDAGWRGIASLMAFGIVGVGRAAALSGYAFDDARDDASCSVRGLQQLAARNVLSFCVGCCAIRSTLLNQVVVNPGCC